MRGPSWLASRCIDWLTMLGPQKPDGDVTFQVGGRFISGLERFELQAPAGSAADSGCPCVIREDPALWRFAAAPDLDRPTMELPGGVVGGPPADRGAWGHLASRAGKTPHKFLADLVRPPGGRRPTEGDSRPFAAVPTLQADATG